MGLYIHVPFCRSLCTYCAFAKQEYSRQAAAEWLHGLRREFAHRRAHTWGTLPVDTLFIGGGTPSALTVGQWRQFGALLREFHVFSPGAECTSEANPESLSKYPDRLRAMLDAGVNRLSMGVQSAHATDLELLGRRHGRAEVESVVTLARSLGVENLSFDLMYGLPGQTESSWLASVDWLLQLEPDHVSAYCLGLEPGTALARNVHAGRVAKPKDAASRSQYEGLCARLKTTGLDHYEISNWAKAGRTCRHNLKYWRRESFAACGPSAHGLMENHRWANPAPLETWLQAYDEGDPPRPKAVKPLEARFEWIFLNLRLCRGFSLDDYCKKWNRQFLRDYGRTADRLQKEGLLEISEGQVRLRPGARFLSDGVFSEFAPV